jgi:ribosomal protein S14
MAGEQLSKISRDAQIGHINDRCGMTSRAASCLSRWRISRLVWRSLADYNQLSGVQRACWGVPTRNSVNFVYKRNRPSWFNTEGYSKEKVIQKDGKKTEVEFRFVR